MKRALALAFNDSYDEDEIVVRRPRWIREREEHFDTLDDKDFVTRFRLTKPTVLSVLESIEHKLEFPTNINNSITPINQLLCALRFYATGCYQITAADLCGFSTSTAHRIVHKVSAAIASMRPAHIYFPESPDEIRQTQIEFYRKARFPYVIGAIDCTHVKFIRSPEYSGENVPFKFTSKNKSVRVLGVPDLPRGCMYDGRWFTEGAAVATREACLRCACARGALSCRRRACAALPDPPPKRCHVLHKKGSCCPELHCPDGVKLMEHGASARFESDDYFDVATPASIAHACVEGGTVYSAGSAMGSGVACEQCFCLGGGRRCVRPRCLPPPPGCRARPAPGACCPQRYYCDHVSTKPPDHKHVHDCLVNGMRISEGERVVAAESKSNCTQCFCLRGAVRCQPLACAPPLLGCTPLLRPGECCPHQYHCDHKFGLATPHFFPISENSLISTRYDDRSFHTDKVEPESTTKIMSTSISTPSTAKNTPSVPATKKEPQTTTKVKRKTNDPPPLSSTKNPVTNATTTTMLTTKTPPTTIAVTVTSTMEIPSTTEEVEIVSSTDQPDGTVKIVINGTINCTAELSSTTVPLNATLNETEIIQSEGHMRTPIDKIDIEAMTEYPNDIITDRSVNEEFDENDTFTINVTSSLRTNNSLTTTRPSLTTVSKVSVPVDMADNSSKKTKGDYDYDYTEPTLPPSLPNLKIIPFVAADAVVDDDASSKETLTYPMLEREDKFPVYYPAVDSPYATRREDPPTQYPVFVSEKAEPSQYPSLTEDIESPNVPYHSTANDLSMPEHDYTLSTSIGASITDLNKAFTKIPSTSSTFGIQTPSVNLFSPPIETEGGFIPKGPGIIDEYYAVYPSTPSAPNVPHLTTSMQLDITKGECVSGDGRHVLEGDSISLACSICTCAWGELHCSPRPCLTPPGCSRRPATTSSVDLCCGELVCEQDDKTTAKPNLLIDIKNNGTKTFVRNDTTNTDDVKPSLPSAADANNTVSDRNIVEIDKSDNTISKNLTMNVETATVSTETVMVTENFNTSSPLVSTAKPNPEYIMHNNTKIQSHDYDEEEEEDEGFSFGSVLKLLLSDNYETTTNAPYKKKATTYIPKTPTTYRTTTVPSTTTRRLPPKPPLLPFIPMPHHPYVPPKKIYTPNTVNRIDHLVLGEATAIKKTTPRPLTTPHRPVSSFKPVSTRQPTTQKPHTTTSYVEPTKIESSTPTPVMHEGPRPPSSSALPLPGILKLAGCNIYGRMYRVGRIITELSTPCQECWCTELGVQCNSLNC